MSTNVNNFNQFSINLSQQNNIHPITLSLFPSNYILIYPITFSFSFSSNYILFIESEVKATAQKFFSLIGGPTHFKATERTLWAAGLCGALYGNHWFFLNEDLFELIGVTTAAVIVFNFAKKPIADGFNAWLNADIARIRNKLAATRNDLAAKRDGLQAYKDVGMVNMDLLRMIRASDYDDDDDMWLKDANNDWWYVIKGCV